MKSKSTQGVIHFISGLFMLLFGVAGLGGANLTICVQFNYNTPRIGWISYSVCKT